MLAPRPPVAALAALLLPACSAGPPPSGQVTALDPRVEARLEGFTARAPESAFVDADGPGPRPWGAFGSVPGVALRELDEGWAVEAPPGPASVTLPRRASGGAQLVDRRSGRGVVVRAAAARDDAGASPSSGMVLYPRGLDGGADLVRRALEDGFQDLVVLPVRGAAAVVRWEVDVSAAAGLRHFADTLELLDDDGSPVLRANPPWVLDAAGAWRAARLGLEGCQADRDARAPRGRPLVRPGAAWCAVTVSWDDTDLVYPLLVDPTWTTTGTLSVGRYRHQSTLLPDGRVLVTGGMGAGFAALASAEIFDPLANAGLGAFTSTAAMPSGRFAHVATLLPDGRVAVTGGLRDALVLGDVHTYQPLSAQWTTHTALGVARGQPAATWLPSGRLLLAGGVTDTTTTPLGLTTSIEVYDFAAAAGAGQSVAAGTLPRAVYASAATLLPGGEVLITGGIDNTQFAAAPTCRWNGSTCPAGPSLRRARGYHAQALLADGRVHLVGGSSPTYLTEVYDPAARTFTDGPDLVDRYLYSAFAVIGDRFIVFANDGDPASVIGRAALYDGEAGTVRALPPLTSPRSRASAVTLADGRVLVTGGAPNTSSYSSTGEILAFAAVGAACTATPDCLEGICTGGVCCSTPCAGACLACRQAETGQPDGTCAPVLAGLDPRGGCADTGAACGTDGACDGAGACRSYPVAAGCTPRPCTLGAECQSGACVDGVCCDAPCGGRCEACTAARKGFGVDGVCEPYRDGTDPENECTPGAAPCAATGACDGAGSCRTFAAPGTACGPVQCAGNRVAGEVCNGGGLCSLDPVGVDCGAFRCVAGGCTTSCAGGADCAPDAWCAAGACRARSGAGVACASADECQGGFCVDGVCCASACAGVCESCAVPGSEGACVPVVGAPRGARGPCPGAGSADPCLVASCDGGERTTCARLPGAETACGVAACNGDVSLPASSCSGSGTCRTPTPSDCTPYRCSAGACVLACAAEADCQLGYRCEGARCVPVGASVCAADGITLVDPTGESRTCAPYRCAAGTCVNPCVSSTDCVPGTVCQEGVCRDPGTDPTAEDSGCGCRTPRLGSSAGGWLGAVPALAAALRRLRRRGPGSARRAQGTVDRCR